MPQRPPPPPSPLLSPGSRALLVIAAPAEARAALRGLGADASLADAAWRTHTLTAHLDLVVTGVGKANAAGASARAFNPDQHAAILSLGIGGALPDAGLPLGAAVLATESRFADEGLLSSEGFTGIDAMGFPPCMGGGLGVPADPSLASALRPLCDREGVVATLSTCSATDLLATAIARRSGAIVEAMEGAAVGVVAQRLGAPFAEIRVVSNTTGERARQQWDIRLALARLEEIVAGLPVV